MAKTFMITLQGGDPRVKPGGEAIFSYFAIGFPVAVSGGGLTYAGDFESFDGDPGSIGQIVINIENNFANYITQSQGFTMDNNVALNEVEIFDTPVPCSLDYDANGYVSTGDIDATFTNFYGASTQDLIDAGLGELSATLDINQDGVVDDLDYPSILEYVGSEGCNVITPVQLSQYPRYLDNYPDSVAFAYSLRKLRSSYEGPCMSVRLDIDARCFSGTADKSLFFKNLCNLGPDFETLPDPSSGFYRRVGDYYDDFFEQDVTLNLGGVFNQEFTNVRDAWNFFKEVFSFLNEPLEIPFTEDGYIDYALIELLMEDPLAAYGVKDTMTQTVQDQFYESYSVQNMHAAAADPYLANFVNLTFKEKAVVLIDTWFDQRADEQRNMVGTVTKANEWGMHPFGMTSLLVGRFGKVMRRDGKFMIGNGTLTGLGDKAHLNRTGEEFGITEMLAETKDIKTSFSSAENVYHGCAYPNAYYLNHDGLGINGMSYTTSGCWAFPNGNEDSLPNSYPDSTNESTSMIMNYWPTIYTVTQYYNFPSETPVEWQDGSNPGWIGDAPTRKKVMQWQVGTAYLRQEQTNAEYLNAFYEADATLWEPTWLTQAVLDGDPVPGFENPQLQETGQIPSRWWTGSNGKRTMFSSIYGHVSAGGTQGTIGFLYTGANNGATIIGDQGFTGYTDNEAPGYREFVETGSHPFGYPPYAFVPVGNYKNAFPENFPEYNAFINTQNLKYDPHISMFRSDQFEVVAQSGVYTNHVYRVYDDMRQPDPNNNIDPGVPATITSSYDHRQGFVIGNYRGQDLQPPTPNLSGLTDEGYSTWAWAGNNTSPNPAAGGNMMEFVAWNDKLPLQAGEDYLKESKTYFENKKIQL